MAEDTKKTAPKTATWVKILLGISLAMNLAVIGLVAGVAVRGIDGPKGGPMRGGFALVAALEREDRRAVLGALREEGRPDRQSRREQSREILALLRSDTFDPEAMKALVTEQVARNRGVQDKMQARLMERISAMTPEERAVYADRLEQRLEKKRGGGRPEGKGH